MGSEKVGASRHNVRATPLNNPSPGSKHPEPPSLIGGGGSTSNKLKNNLVDLSPPPIKRRANESCYSGRPCGDLWNTHTNLGDLRRHLHYLFGISWPAISRIVGEYGVDHINQNLHETQEYVRDQLAQGRPIKGLARVFMYCMDGIRDAEPELSAEAAAERDVTVMAGVDALKPKKKPKDDRSKYLEEKIKRTGSR
jgi:hypothetical protein